MEHYKNLDLADIKYVCEETGELLTEEWRDVPEYENLYQASNLGRAKSLGSIKVYKRGGIIRHPVRILVQTISGKYLSVGFYKNRKRHQGFMQVVMAETFLGIKTTREHIADHIDNNPLNNVLWNIQVITHRENCSKDKVNSNGFTGTHKDKNKFRAMIDFKNVRYSLGSFYSPIDAHKTYLEAVRLIDAGESFSHLVNQKSKEPNKVWSKLTEVQVLEIRAIGGNMTQKEIGTIYNISIANISDILNHKTWRNI